jgi:DNA repair protein RadC
MTTKEEILHVREMLTLYGNDTLTDEDVLESIIDSAKAKILSRNLIKKYGDIASVFDAPLREFEANGIGRELALRIKSLPIIAQRYLRSIKERQYKTAKSSTAMCDYVSTLFIGDTEEKFVLISLNSACGIIKATTLSRGTVNASEVSLRKIAEQALADRASNAVIAHNHPSGSLIVSREDINTTQKVKELLSKIGINLIDHIIVANGETTSLAETGDLEKL